MAVRLKHGTDLVLLQLSSRISNKYRKTNAQHLDPSGRAVGLAESLVRGGRVLKPWGRDLIPFNSVQLETETYGASPPCCLNSAVSPPTDGPSCISLGEAADEQQPLCPEHLSPMSPLRRSTRSGDTTGS